MIPYYLDEDLSRQIAILGRRRGVDIVSAQELDHRGIDDVAQLLLAAELGRCVVTRNVVDFIRFTLSFQERRLPHAGVLLLPSPVRGNEYAAIVAALSAYDREHPDGVPPYFVDYLRVPRR